MKVRVAFDLNCFNYFQLNGKKYSPFNMESLYKPVLEETCFRKQQTDFNRDEFSAGWRAIQKGMF